MDSLAIATYPRELSVLSGESLPVHTVIENLGASPASVPSRDAPSRFEYEIRELREGKIVYAASAELTRRRRARDLVRVEPVPPEMLPPKQKADWDEDLAEMLNEGIVPGKYAVTAKLEPGGLISPRAMVTVLAPNLESYSSYVSQGVLTSVMAHRRSDGGAELLQRDSMVRDPREGVFFQRQKLARGGKVSVAGSVDVAPAGNGRWFAWLDDGKLTASNGWGNAVMLTTQPVAAEGELLDPGFQIDVGTALFGVVSRRGGSTRLDTYLASPKGLSLNWSAILNEGTAGQVRWHWENGVLMVVWETGDGASLMRLSLSRDGKASGSPERLTQVAGAAAWGMNTDGPLNLWVIRQGSTGVQVGLVSLRSVYRLPTLAGARLWGVCGEGADLRVVAADESKIWLAAGDGAEWRQLAEAKNPQWLRTFSMRSCWAEWLEPEYGVRRVRLQ